ncbi:MAG: adenylate/guanylate cyclase domain-containing protein [Planctomycetota bacterium]
MPVLKLKEAGRTREIEVEKDNFRVGRTPDNDLEIPSPVVSRRQFSIVREGEGYVLYDLDSSNGTYVNGERVQKKGLSEGDVIRVGDVEISFSGAGAPVPVPSPLPSPPPPPPPPPKGSPPPPGAPTKVPMGVAGEIIENIDDIAESYALDISGALSQGLSLEDIRKGSVKADRESQMFFVLYQVGRQLGNAQTLVEMLEVSMRLIFESINCERGAILLVDPKKKELTQKLTYHREKGVVDGELGVSSTITGRVLNDRVATITSDALQDPRFMQGLSIVQYNIRSALCVPLWESERTLGVIYLDNLAKAYAFTRDDLELLTAIANLVAIRIMQEELQEKLREEEVKRTRLSRYHSPDVVEHLMSREEGLEPQEREVTVLFVDIEQSTALAERMGPTKVSSLLNKFFEMATNGVFENKGNLNKYIGDEVLAIFNAPVDVPEHEEAAVRAAVLILENVRKHNTDNPDRHFNIRIGINTGITIAGDVGPPQCKEYTVLGDTVNTAARLVSLPDVNRIVIGETTHKKVKDKFETKDLGEVQLKGKAKPTRAYQIVV